jgi:N,N'-diacetylbacillosaminyl-diphospho-undecaprenol alpha-1,3-N-acetylgalactosaminyltransferase
MKKIIFLSQLDINLVRFRLPIMKALMKQNYKVYAMVPKGEYAEELVKCGAEVVFYDLDRRSLNPLKELKTCIQLFKKIKQIHPDIIHTFTIKPNIYGGIIAKVLGIPKIVTAITGLGGFFSENSMSAKCVQSTMKLFYRMIKHCTSMVVFQNADDLDYFISENILRKDQTRLIRGSGIDTSTWKTQRAEKQNTDVIKFILVARLLKQKGVIEFCEAASQLNKQYKAQIECVILGDEDPANKHNITKSQLQPFIKNNDIVFLGWRDNIKDQLSERDIFVLPSYYREGIPRTGIEAASMAMPIITTNSIGCKELVDDQETGILIKPKSIDSLVQAMEVFIKDRRLIYKMGQKSRKKAEVEFDVNKVILEHIKIYEDQ